MSSKNQKLQLQNNINVEVMLLNISRSSEKNEFWQNYIDTDYSLKKLSRQICFQRFKKSRNGVWTRKL